MIRSLIYIVLLFSAVTTFAQTKGCFKAYAPSGEEITTLCVGQEVSFQDCGNQVPDDKEYYVFDYKSGSQIPAVSAPVKKHTYTAPGKYRVLQIANYGGSTLTDTASLVFEVKATPAPAFTLTACANNAVSVNLSDATYDSYTVNFGDGSAAQQAPKGATLLHTYGSTGTYTVQVTGKYTGGTCSGNGSKQIATLPPFVLPKLQSVVVKQQSTAGELQLDIQNLQPGYLYVVERWQNPRINFQKLDTIKNVTQSNVSYTLQNVNTAEGVWYLIRVADQCGSVISSSNSNIVSAIALQATAGNEQATLNWKSMPWADSYEVYRNNTLIATVGPAINNYTDAGLSCGQTYTYYIKGRNADGSSSTSAVQQVQVTSAAIPAAPHILASFNLENNVELTLILPQNKVAQKIDIQKSINGAAYQSLASVQQPDYLDKVNTLNPVCYQATFTDPCNNTSPVSNTTCPMILKAERLDDGSVQLNWTAFTGFLDGVGQYTVELLDAAGNVAFYTVVTGTSYTDRTLSNDLQLLRYRIRALSRSGAEVSYSNLQEIRQDLQLYIPSAFTPNNDGLNDEFEIKGRFVENYTLKVYNSLGTVVFQSSDNATNWNGTYQGNPLPAGAYAYEITVKTSFGTSKRRTGTVTLIR